MQNQTLRLVQALAVAGALLAGCATETPAPVRDGNLPPAAAGPAAAPAPARAGYHVVRPGETLLGIARQYGRTVGDLVTWNALGDPNQIHAGQELRVAPPEGAVVQVQPITSGGPIEVKPVTPPRETAAAPIKQEPRGGKQPYSDEAWAALQRPETGNGAQAATPPVAPVPADRSKPPGPEAAWLWPTAGKLLATFNEATNKGIDISGNPGDAVVAAAAGKVVYSGSGLRGYGKLVIIKHDDDYLTAYAHNRQLLVKEGDSVTKGQKIAELGSTDADRPMLHFEIRKQGHPVDPLKYLPTR